jgi:hypothetical protein
MENLAVEKSMKAVYSRYTYRFSSTIRNSSDFSGNVAPSPASAKSGLSFILGELLAFKDFIAGRCETLRKQAE